MRTNPLFPSVLALILATGCGHPTAQAAAGGAPAPFATPPVLAGTPDIATLVAAVKSSVVHISTTQEARRPAGPEMPFPFPFPGPFGGDQPHKQEGLGTGFIVDTDGHVVTNAHVVAEADVVRVRLDDDREVDARVIGRDPRLDLAVLEVPALKGKKPASLGSSEALRVGEYVVAIGNPFGLDHTVTMGIVSAKSRTIGAGPYDDFIQTDASINPGNSGGPLFNLRGQVVGINSAINPNGKGIGFAIPVDALREVLPQLIAKGTVSRGRLGVTIQPVDPALAKALSLDRARGALVSDVERGGPAEKAGIQPGDLIEKVDGVEVARSLDLPRLVARHAPGTHVNVTLLRNRAVHAVNVQLEALQEERPGGPWRKSDPGRDYGIGLEVGDLPGGGVVVQRVLPGAAEGQLLPGDVIVEANRAPVQTGNDLRTQLAATPKGQALLLKVRRQGQTRFVAIERP